jgi:hypothetical protein
MDTLTQILHAARTLSPAERRRLIIELDSLDSQEQANGSKSRAPFAALRALAGSAHSDFTDLSTNKYPHTAADKTAAISKD